MAALVKSGTPAVFSWRGASSSTPTTPASKTVATPNSRPSTGTWRHPRLEEITQRQRASNFTDRNVRTLLWNSLLLFSTFAVVRIFRYLLNPDPLNFLAGMVMYPRTLRWIIRSLFIYNIIAALRPLLRRKDDLADIPLTPSQRALLGLDPSSTPATPDSQYVTPPRYSRSSTPRNSGDGRGGSPLSNRERGSALGRSGSPFSPVASPLLHKAIGGGMTRRHSHGSQLPPGGSVFGPSSSGSSTPATPTPVTGKNPSVALNSKWLYEKGRSSLGGRGLYA